MSESRELVLVSPRRVAMRWALRLAFVVFGTAIGLVVASEPRVIAAVQHSAASIGTRLAGEAPNKEAVTDRTVRPVTREVKASEPIFSAQRFENLSSNLPRVRVMPESKVNVIRLTP
ncbi:MAG: hypothetical protein EP307_03800 [Rhodobacteraceae bacterium]|nr:MAG: hypothetical protein EP307_03800 [Paracoccaceae bacterium]